MLLTICIHPEEMLQPVAQVPIQFSTYKELVQASLVCIFLNYDPCLNSVLELHL